MSGAKNQCPTCKKEGTMLLFETGTRAYSFNRVDKYGELEGLEPEGSDDVHEEWFECSSCRAQVGSVDDLCPREE